MAQDYLTGGNGMRVCHNYEKYPYQCKKWILIPIVYWGIIPNFAAHILMA